MTGFYYTYARPLASCSLFLSWMSSVLSFGLYLALNEYLSVFTISKSVWDRLYRIFSRSIL